jgi:hypothetical protein
VQKSSLSKPESFSRQDPRKYGRIMKNKSPGRENTQYDLESEHPTQGNRYEDAESDTVGNYSHARQTEDMKTETKMRKTLGYFKTEALCFRGARTSESKNRSERGRQELHNAQNHMSEGPVEFKDRVDSVEREYLNEENEYAEQREYRREREEDYDNYENEED